MKPEHAKHPANLRAEFDLIARLSAGQPDILTPCERWLLAQAPPRIDEALDVGCGAGAFTRELAGRARHVVGIDLSPAMIELARRRSSHLSNVEFAVQDAATCELPPKRFDCVASLAMLHHLPLRPMLLRLRAAVAPGGVLLVQDLDDSTRLADLPRNALAWTMTRLTGPPREPKVLADAWRRHGHGERYPRLSDVRALCDEVLPGATVVRHLAWRYSILWRADGDRHATGGRGAGGADQRPAVAE